MARQVVSKWRESASLIILAKDRAMQSNSFDYKVLMFKRAAKASFMANSAVFPGGVHEATDETPLWLKHFDSFGCSAEQLQELTRVCGPRPSIFKKDGEHCLDKEISLRITAIRETFEEVGILFCRHRASENKKTTVKNEENHGYGHYCNDIDRSSWQKLVHDDHTKFLTLCRELDVVPDLWSLHEWSVWLTPSYFQKRFETAFYVVALDSLPEVLPESREVTEVLWMTPLEYLKCNMSKQINLPPPQSYELSRLLNFTKLADVKNFARKRAQKGSTLLLPVHRNCTDGMVGLMPGDDMYPDDPNETHEVLPTHVTLEEYRSGVKKLHRAEFTESNFTLHLNFSPNNDHLKPLDVKDFCKKS